MWTETPECPEIKYLPLFIYSISASLDPYFSLRKLKTISLFLCYSTQKTQETGVNNLN